MASASPATKKIELPFAAGLAQQFDVRHAPESTAYECLNKRWTHEGAVARRPGNEALAVLTGGAGRLVTRGTELAAVSAVGGLYSYSPAKEDFVSKGQVAEALLTRTGLYADSLSPSHADIAYGNGVVVAVWMAGEDVAAGADIYVSVTDATNGSTIVPAYNVSGVGGLGVYPRVVYLSGSESFIILYAEATGNDIVVATVSSAYAISGIGNLITDNATGNDFGVSALSDRYVVAWQPSGGTDPKVFAYGPTHLTLATSTITDAEAATKYGFGVQCVASECVWVSYCGETGAGDSYVKLSRKNVSTLAELSSFPVDVASSATHVFKATCPTRVSATNTLIAISGRDDTNENDYIAAPVWSTSGAVVGSMDWETRITSRCAFASAAFVAPNGRTYAFVYTQGYVWTVVTPPEYPSFTCVLVDLEATDTTSVLRARPVGVTMPRIAISDNASYTFTYRTIPAVIQPASGYATFAGRMLKSNAGREGLQLITADFVNVGLYSPAELGGSTAMVPGIEYDGVRAHELGFIQCAPEIRVTTPVGGTMAAGDYAVVCVPEYVDVNGNLHQGTPTSARAVTCALNDKIYIEIPCITLTRRAVSGDQSIAWAVYMTSGIAGTTSGPFYRTTTVVANDVGAPTVIAQVTTPDAYLASRPTIYTTGGVLENVCPPSMSHIVEYRGRLVGVSDDKITIWFSKVYLDGDGTGWSDGFTLSPLDEPITGLAVMDDRLIVFTRARPYWTAFDGPPDVGGQSDVGPLRPIPSDNGCIDARSLVVIPPGLLFQSAAGLQLLTRGLQVVTPSFGLPVQDEAATYDTIECTAVHPTDSVVYLGFTDGAEAGERVVYDFGTNRWGVDDVGSTTVSMAVVNGSIYSLDSDGNMSRELTDSHLDAGAWFNDAYSTAWLHPLGVQGTFSPVKLVLFGKKMTSHRLAVDVYADDDNVTPLESWDLSSVSLDALASDGREQFSRAFKVRRNIQAIRVRIRQLVPSTGLGTGEGCVLLSLTLELDPGTQTPFLTPSRKG